MNTPPQSPFLQGRLFRKNPRAKVAGDRPSLNAEVTVILCPSALTPLLLKKFFQRLFQLVKSLACFCGNGQDIHSFLLKKANQLLQFIIC